MLRFGQLAETRRWSEVPQVGKCSSAVDSEKRAPRMPQAMKLLSHGKHGMEAVMLQPRNIRAGKFAQGARRAGKAEVLISQS